MKRSNVIIVVVGIALVAIASSAAPLIWREYSARQAEQQFVAAYSGHKEFETIYPVIKDARERIKKNPRHHAAFHSLAQSYFTLGAFEQARDALLAATNIAPDNDAYWSFLGKTYQRLKAYPDAANAYARALELSPKKVEHYTQLAWLYYFRFEGDDMQKSYGILKQGLEQFSNDKDLLYDITRYYLYENKMAEFAEYALRYLQVDPQDKGGFRKELDAYQKK